MNEKSSKISQALCNFWAILFAHISSFMTESGFILYYIILQLLISSLVEFKIGKVRLHMIMKDSADKIIRKAYPEIKSGRKWSAVKATQEAECSLRIKDIIGVTQTNWAGLGSTSKKVFSKVGPKEKRDMVSEEVRMFEEEQRKASAVTQAKQCAWAKWNDIEPIKLS